MSTPMSPFSLHAAAAPAIAASRHNPYHSDSEHDDSSAYASGATSARGTAAASGGSQPPAYTEVPQAPQGTVHTPLLGVCEFLQIPSISPRGSELRAALPEHHFSLFLGQIRFEVQAQELRWLLRKVAGVTAAKVDTRGPGCFLVHLRTEKEVAAVQMLHKRLLFDVTGVWYARTADEVEAMQACVSRTPPQVSRRFRLPRDSMVVEEQKSRSGAAAAAAAAAVAAAAAAPAAAGHNHLSGAELDSARSSMANTPCASPYHGSRRPYSGLPLPSYVSSSAQSSCGDSPSLAPMTPMSPPPPYIAC